MEYAAVSFLPSLGLWLIPSFCYIRPLNFIDGNRSICHQQNRHTYGYTQGVDANLQALTFRSL